MNPSVYSSVGTLVRKLLSFCHSYLLLLSHLLLLVRKLRRRQLTLEYLNQPRTKRTKNPKKFRRSRRWTPHCHCTSRRLPVGCPEVEFIRGLKRKTGYRPQARNCEIVLLDEYAVRFCGRKFSVGRCNSPCCFCYRLCRAALKAAVGIHRDIF